MVDIHSHILPGIDDGSRDVEESLRLLALSRDQGIERMAATSHFYPFENSPERFLRRRDAAAQQLREAVLQRQPDSPPILLGAEVYYFDGISRADEVLPMRIETTPLLLLEMPFSEWSSRMVTEVQRLNDRPEVQVLLAHIERYLRFQRPEVWEELLRSGVWMQSNADFFLHWRTRRKAARMLEAGRIHLIGSDCHNTHSRPPKIGAALDRLGSGGCGILEQNIARWLSPAVQEPVG